MEQSPQREPAPQPEQPDSAQQAGQHGSVKETSEAAPEHQGGSHAGEPEAPAAGRRVRQEERVPALPSGLVFAAGWGWRLLVLGLVGYAVVRILALLGLAVLSVLAALFFTALLFPLTRLLRRYMPALLAAFLTLLIAVAGIGGIGYFVGIQTAASFPALVDQLIATLQQVLGRLQQLPGVEQFNLEQLQQRVIGFLQQNRQQLTNLLLAGGRYLVTFLTGLALAIIVTFFFVYEGERLWGWLVARLPARAATRADGAGRIAWQTISGYVQGTAVIATFHGTVMGITLVLLDVPLVIPLAVLMFLGSFVPIVGALVAGGVAVLVALGTKGLITAAILLAVLVVENQIEGNVLQPLVMGHYVRLHPLAILLALTVGGLLAGIIGAIIAVPVAAVVYRAVPVLLGWNEPGEQPSPASTPQTRSESYVGRAMGRLRAVTAKAGTALRSRPRPTARPPEEETDMHLGLGDEYSPEMESFLTRVQQLGGLSSHDEADRVTRATLTALGERITGGQMGDLAPGLPMELRSEIDHARGQAIAFEKSAFLDQITAGIDTVDIERAEAQARGVLRTLYERAPEGEISDTLAQLPPELSRLFE